MTAEIKLTVFTNNASSGSVIMKHFSEALFEPPTCRPISFSEDEKDSYEPLLKELFQASPKSSGLNFPEELNISYPSSSIVSNTLIFSAIVQASLQGIFKLVDYLQKLEVRFIITECDGKVVR